MPIPDRNARQPLLDGIGWDDREVVCDRLSQMGARGDGVAKSNEGWRCAPSSFLAAVIMTDSAPPNGLRSICSDLRSRFMADQSIPKRDRMFRRAQLSGIESRLQNGAATYGDMHTLQQYLYDIYGSGDDGVYIDAARGLITGMTGTGAATTRNLIDGDEFVFDLDPVIDVLGPGESVIVTVAADEDGVANHAISIGKSPEGRVFLYDPGVAIGQHGEHGHTLFRDTDVVDFYAHLSDRAEEATDAGGQAVFGFRIAGKSAFSLK
jgi:hypothetical protein